MKNGKPKFRIVAVSEKPLGSLDDLEGIKKWLSGAKIKKKTIGEITRKLLAANGDQDRQLLRKIIKWGLIDREFLATLPAELADRLTTLLSEAGT